MAHGISDPECKKEYFDSQAKLSTKLDQLTQWIKESRHLIVFTGAGISTSTGIPDFRSAMDTVLPTGPGEWELQDNERSRSRIAVTIDDMQKAIPSLTHMALVELQRRGIVKFVISQNCDGLHLRSGIKSTNLAELHGNMNLEICAVCDTKYLRDFDTDTGRADHCTGRRCVIHRCRGQLKDSLISFGESLSKDELNKAYNHAEKADVCLVLGSSLSVTSAAEIPERVAKQKQKLIIGNLQRTPLHDCATLSIHAFTDTIMQGLMNRLNLQIPTWILRRRIRIRCRIHKNANKSRIYIDGLDPDNTNITYSIFKSIQLFIDNQIKQQLALDEQPFLFEISNEQLHPILIRLHFFGHYDEPHFDLNYINVKHFAKEELFYLFYNPFKRQWHQTIHENDLPF